MQAIPIDAVSSSPAVGVRCGFGRALALALAIALPDLASAATLRVPADHASIQQAVDAAQSGDVIEIARGTYAPFVIDARTNLVLRGKGRAVVDGGGALGAIVSIANSTNIVLDKLTIEDSGERGVLVTDSSVVVMRRSTIRDIASEAIRAWASSNLLIEKCRITNAGGGVDFLAEGMSAASSQSVVQKNRFERLADPIALDGAGHRVEKNRFSRTDGVTIALADMTTDATIAKNNMTDVEAVMQLRGSGHVVEKNTIRRASDDGIVVTATDCRVEKNRLDRVADDGIDLEGDDNEILSNRIKQAGNNGIEVSPAVGAPFAVTGNRIESNRIFRSNATGIFVDTAGNTFRANKAARNGGFDLLDLAGAGANTYVRNRFGSELIP